MGVEGRVLREWAVQQGRVMTGKYEADSLALMGWTIAPPISPGTASIGATVNITNPPVEKIVAALFP